MKNSIIAFALVVGFAACEKVEKLDKFPLEPSKLVLNGVLNDGYCIIEMSKSLPSIDNADNRSIDDAEVFLYEDDILINSASESSGDGVYAFLTTLSDDKIYRVDAFHPSYPSVTATTELPRTLDAEITDHRIVDSTQFSYTSGGFEQTNIYINRGILEISIDDQIDGSFIKLVPSISYYRNGDISEEGYVYINSSTTGERIGTDVFINGEEGSVILEDLSLEYSTSLRIYENQNVDSVMFSFKIVKYSEGLFNYEKTRAQFFESQLNPFADPVQVYSNVEGGFGVLGGQFETESSIRIY